MADELPPLPEPQAWKYWHKVDSNKVATVTFRMDHTIKGADEYTEIPMFTDDQMRAYAQEAARQERERCGRDAERYKVVREGTSSDFSVVCGPDDSCRFLPEGLDDACDRAMSKE